MTLRKAVISIGTLALAFTGALPVFAIDSAFGGAWQLDVAKSTLYGDPVTFTKLPGGKMRLSSGQTFSFVFACDGAAYQTVSNSRMSCMKIGPRSYRFSWVGGGKTTAIETVSIASDDKTYESVEVHPIENGSLRTSIKHYTRRGNGTGLIGTWDTPGDARDIAQFLAITTMTNGVSYSFNHLPFSLTVRFDGSKARYAGTGIPKAAYVLGKAIGDDEVFFRQMLGGRDVGDSVWQFRDDRRTLVWTGWRPGAKLHPTILVYHKQ